MKILITILVIMFVSGFSLYAYYGGLKRIRPQKVLAGGELIAFKNVSGDYRQSGAVSDDVYDRLLAMGIETYRGFGIYYDDPREVAVEKLRSEVGCIIEEKDRHKLVQIKEVFQVKELEKKEYLTVDFPYRNPFSSFMGVLKVHPQLKKAGSEGFVMEIWDIPNKKIEYRKEIIE